MASSFIFIFSAALFLLPILTTIEAKVPAIIVFGDSTVDSGNNNYIPTFLKSNFAPYGRDFDGGKSTGRFSDGKLPTDFISEYFGIKTTIPAYLDPQYNITDFATGVCFASAGTGYDNVTSNVLSVIPFWKEMEYYKEYQKKLRSHLGTSKANTLISEALYLISIGTNDFLENYFLLPTRRVKYSVEQYQNFLAGIAENFIREIYSLGARKIAVTGLPPMGCVPLERATKGAGRCYQKYNNVAMDFNNKTKGLVDKLNKELKGIQLVFSNIYDLLSDIIDHPASFGFNNAAKACCGTGYIEMSYMCSNINPFTCSDTDKHVFWDSFHPTQKTNFILATHIFRTDLHQFLG